MESIKRIGEFSKKPIVFTEWEYAWNIEDVQQLLEFVMSNNQIILGGDILTTNLEYTYDNWGFNPVETDTEENNVKNSFLVAKQYISKYIQKNGLNYCVVLVVK